MPKKKYGKTYKYYRFVVRTEKILSSGEIQGIKRAIWSHLQDIAITDIQASKSKKPTLRFEGDKVVRK